MYYVLNMFIGNIFSHWEILKILQILYDSLIECASFTFRFEMLVAVMEAVNYPASRYIDHVINMVNNVLKTVTSLSNT